MKEINADIFYQPIQAKTSKTYFKKVFDFAVKTGAKTYIMETSSKASSTAVLSGLLAGLAHLGKRETGKIITHVFTTPTKAAIPKAFWWNLECRGPLDAIATLRPKKRTGLVVVPNCKDTEALEQATGMICISAKLT